MDSKDLRENWVLVSTKRPSTATCSGWVRHKPPHTQTSPSEVSISGKIIPWVILGLFLCSISPRCCKEIIPVHPPGQGYQGLLSTQRCGRWGCSSPGRAWFELSRVQLVPKISLYPQTGQQSLKAALKQLLLFLCAWTPLLQHLKACELLTFWITSHLYSSPPHAAEEPGTPW